MKDELLNIFNSVLTNAELENIKELKSEADLRDDLGLDSLNLAELTVRIEDEFDIDVFEDGLVLTVGEIISKIEARV